MPKRRLRFTSRIGCAPESFCYLQMILWIQRTGLAPGPSHSIMSHQNGAQDFTGENNRNQMNGKYGKRGNTKSWGSGWDMMEYGKQRAYKEDGIWA